MQRYYDSHVAQSCHVVDLFYSNVACFRFKCRTKSNATKYTIFANTNDMDFWPILLLLLSFSRIKCEQLNADWDFMRMKTDTISISFFVGVI